MAKVTEKAENILHMLVRSSEREKGIPADSAWQRVMDEHYGDEVLKKIYPNALKVE